MKALCSSMRRSCIAIYCYLLVTYILRPIQRNTHYTAIINFDIGDDSHRVSSTPHPVCNDVDRASQLSVRQHSLGIASLSVFQPRICRPSHSGRVVDHHCSLLLSGDYWLLLRLPLLLSPYPHKPRAHLQQNPDCSACLQCLLRHLALLRSALPHAVQ